MNTRTLKGWRNALPQAAVEALTQGTLQIVAITFKDKEYELLVGYYYEEGMKKEFP